MFFVNVVNSDIDYEKLKSRDNTYIHSFYHKKGLVIKFRCMKFQGNFLQEIELKLFYYPKIVFSW